MKYAQRLVVGMVKDLLKVNFLLNGGREEDMESDRSLAAINLGRLFAAETQVKRAEHFVTREDGAQILYPGKVVKITITYADESETRP